MEGGAPARQRAAHPLTAAVFVIVPGIGDSDPDHWQSRWEREWSSSASRVVVSSWDRPDRDDWTRAVRSSVESFPDRPVVLVAHSLGCWAAADDAVTSHPAVAGLFLVAPPDPGGPSFPSDEAPTFVPVEPRPLLVPSLVVLSDDDPYCSPGRGQHFADRWGSAVVRAGPLGHINSTSGLGAWDQGRALLTAFVAGLGLDRVHR